jgi:hypothetical protein
MLLAMLPSAPTDLCILHRAAASSGQAATLHWCRMQKTWAGI